MSRKLLTSKQVHKIRELTSNERVLVLGRLRLEYVAAMVNLGRHNVEVVLTGERRGHYLTQHPEMAKYEDQLASVVLNPDQVHRNRKERHTAIFYKALDKKYFLRVAVVLQARAGEMKHSVFSFRLAKQRGVEAGKRAGRVVWQRK